MKKLLFNCFTAIVLIWTITSSYSQNPVVSPKPETPERKIISLSDTTIQLQHSNPLRLNEINANAASTFTKDHPTITNAKWFKSQNGLFFAYFTGDNIKNWVFYNSIGICEYMILHYYEEKLPAEIRLLVKNAYSDFSIYHVTEIHRNGKIAYALKLEDKTSWKTIKVVDDEIEVMEEYSKR